MIPVFIDTSGFYAFLDREDSFHCRAKDLFCGRTMNSGFCYLKLRRS